MVKLSELEWHYSLKFFEILGIFWGYFIFSRFSRTEVASDAYRSNMYLSLTIQSAQHMSSVNHQYNFPSCMLGSFNIIASFSNHLEIVSVLAMTTAGVEEARAAWLHKIFFSESILKWSG